VPLVGTPAPPQVGVPWRIDVTLVKWIPDVLLTLNFVGPSAHELEGHPLQIDSVDPPEAVWEDAKTKHSVTYRLRPVKGGDPGALHIIAYGRVTNLGQVECCCAPPPPPPPDAEPPPPMPPPPSPLPRPPPPPPFAHVENVKIAGNEESQLDQQAAMERAAAAAAAGPVPTNSVGETSQTVFVSVVVVIVLYIYGQKWLKRLREHLRFLRIKKDVAQRFGGRSARAADAAVAGDDDDDDDDGNDDEALETGWGGKVAGGQATWGGSKVRPTRRAVAGPTLSMQLSDGSAHEAELDLSSIRSMRELQAVVLREWSAAGGDRRESLMMEYVDATGSAVKVSQTTDIGTLKHAITLNLLPKRWRAKRQSYGRLQQDALDSVREEEEGDSRSRAAGGLD